MKKSILQEEDKFILRMPDGMRKQFADIAQINKRSLNAELVHRLSLSLQIPDDKVAYAAQIFKSAGFDVTVSVEKRTDKKSAKKTTS
jgi:sugar/nucleoside kinase (ribokinase family)